MKKAGWALWLFLFTGAKADIMVVGSLTHEKVCRPGESYAGEIAIKNCGAQEEEVRIYQTDYSFQSDGTNRYGEPGRMSRSNASWIAFSPKRFRIPAGEQMTVQYVVHVPAADTLEGTYWSIIMAEAVSQVTPETLSKRSLGISTVLRYGIQLISQIGETGMKSIRFMNTELRNQDGKCILQVDIENTGDRMLRPHVWADLFDGQGRSLGSFQGETFRVYPASSIRHRIELNGVGNGRYKALIVADCGEDDVFAVQYSLMIEP